MQKNASRWKEYVILHPYQPTSILPSIFNGTLAVCFLDSAMSRDYDDRKQGVGLGQKWRIKTSRCEEFFDKREGGGDDTLDSIDVKALRRVETPGDVGSVVWPKNRLSETLRKIGNIGRERKESPQVSLVWHWSQGILPFQDLTPTHIYHGSSKVGHMGTFMNKNLDLDRWKLRWNPEARDISASYDWKQDNLHRLTSKPDIQAKERGRDLIQTSAVPYETGSFATGLSNPRSENTCISAVFSTPGILGNSASP
ncbi:uncharacterized protein BDR25DRAFT_361751 [Lindgomyces ingoldianus]|uniref:Uncharacterized protein n=1 Tax=Lindgomyces ingoldianus TaxID=673940 RepID=A0ACB6QDM2_9PLEO|nr:uncharacterized protein BDR25DRAFT_361751 [Lindgomyces ingoldianus]KAF2464241.1 hypothetical protein BDR25DRAFT_361751 [Lindgomyces ingoldianus]